MGDTSELVLEGVLCQECYCVFEDCTPSEAEYAAAKRRGELPEGKPGPNHPRTCRVMRAEKHLASATPPRSEAGATGQGHSRRPFVRVGPNAGPSDEGDGIGRDEA